MQLFRSDAIPPQFHCFSKSLLTGTVMGDSPDNIDPDCDSGDSDSEAESE